jgi:hypothetical protein
MLRTDQFASRANEPNTPDTVDLNVHEDGATEAAPLVIARVRRNPLTIVVFRRRYLRRSIQSLRDISTGGEVGAGSVDSAEMPSALREWLKSLQLQSFGMHWPSKKPLLQCFHPDRQQTPICPVQLSTPPRQAPPEPPQQVYPLTKLWLPQQTG